MRESLFVLNSIFRSALDIWTIPAFSFAELKVVPFSQHTVQQRRQIGLRAERTTSARRDVTRRRRFFSFIFQLDALSSVIHTTPISSSIIK
jgi:hypothetical protein